MAFVYWIHTKNQSDFTSEGYVGITSKSVRKRFMAHKTSAFTENSRLVVHKAMRKYGDDITVDILVEGQLDYCLLIENKLRPTENIGWNIGIGGSRTTLGFKHTSETKEKISVTHKGKKFSKEKKDRYLDSYKTKVVSAAARTNAAIANSNRHSWENSRGNGAWLIADEIFEFCISNPVNQYQVSQFFKLPYSRIGVIYKKIKSGWNPLKDEDWLNFRRSKLTPDTTLENKPKLI